VDESSSASARRLWYWFGHQGYEYVDLGRVWQIFLFAGLFIWLGLMLRALWPALQRKDEAPPAARALRPLQPRIALFYGAGSCTANPATSRGRVLALVGGAPLGRGLLRGLRDGGSAFLLVRLGVLRPGRAVPAVLFATTIFLGGGIIGTLHHLYFTGTQPPALALGAVVQRPRGRAALDHRIRGVAEPASLVQMKPWLMRYKWPIYFFVAVAFWNLVGAGLFGFLINPPIALYYMQGLNLTPVHGHTALFGVYGMLGIGLMLFCPPRAQARRRLARAAPGARLLGPQRGARADGHSSRSCRLASSRRRPPSSGAPGGRGFFVGRYVAALRGPSAKPVTPSAKALPVADEPSAAE
jgi:nitric oxide reductase subunit B